MLGEPAAIYPAAQNKQKDPIGPFPPLRTAIFGGRPLRGIIPAKGIAGSAAITTGAGAWSLFYILFSHPCQKGSIGAAHFNDPVPMRHKTKTMLFVPGTTKLVAYVRRAVL